MASIYGNDIGIIPLTDAAGITQEFKPGKHYGIDIGWHASVNCPVLAWQDGVVVDCGYGSQVGNFLVVEHDYGKDGHRWTGYIHLKDKPNLRVGDKVYFGKPMGNARRGNTGASAGVHLHLYLTRIVSKITKYTWGTMKSNSIDPKPYLYYDKKYNTEYISANSWKKPLPSPIVQPVERDLTRDQLICHTDDLRVRDSASLSGKVLGHLQKDKYYNLLGTAESEGYTWCKLADSQWVAKIEEVEILPKVEIVQPVERDTKKDQLTCSISNLRVRVAPNLKGEQIGFLQKDAFYDYFDKAVNDGYAWFKLAEDQWVAKVEEVTLLPKQQDVVQPVERDETKDQLTCSINNLRVRVAPSLKAEQIGFLQANAFYDFFATTEADGYTWLKVADEQWVAKVEEVTVLPKVVYYTVVDGDTLESIAVANGITLEQLVALNPQLAVPGTELRIQ